jgi:hypothetical protein
MEDIKQKFLEWVVGNMEYGYLYEDVTDDGDGIYQLTGEGEDVADFIEQELDKAREGGRLSVIQELLFEPEEPSHNIGTLEAAFKYRDIIKRYSGEWRNKTGLVSPKYIKSKLKDNK